MAETKTKNNNTQKAGFSVRLNLVLDHAGYAPMDRGRVKALALDMDLANMTISKWLSKDVVPHGGNLNTLARVLLRKLGCFASAESMECWLVEGDEAFNPLILSSHKGIDYVLFSKVFDAVDKVAQKEKIKIQDMPQSRLDLLYATMIRQAARNPEHTLDLDLIKDFLKAPIAR